MIFGRATDLERALTAQGIAHLRADLSLRGIRILCATPADAWTAARALRATLWISPIERVEGEGFAFYVKALADAPKTFPGSVNDRVVVISPRPEDSEKRS